MRQRAVKNLEERIDNLSAYLVSDPAELRGAWREAFGKEKLFLELGCGKGQFVSRLARLNPDSGFVAIEGQDRVMLRVLEKAGTLEEETGQKNLKIVCMFVQDLNDIFAPEELDGIYLNFSDPWPKASKKKRRLTYRERLRAYMTALKPGGFVEFKTDNAKLFEFTLEEIKAAGLEPVCCSDDYHADVTTEYEDKFIAQGLPIHFVRIEKGEI